MDYLETDLKHEFLSRLYEPMSELWEHESPKHLWQIGKLPESRKDRLVVSIVGSRKCTDYGVTVAYETAFKLAKLDAIVVSGLASGIDSSAHLGCLDGGGQTVAVLGTPIDRLYPVTNVGLARRIIAQNGAIISEFRPGSKVRPHHFVRRNRIVSGLADAVIIVEATERSGTFSTANFANEQGRSVFAVPGDITREASVGTNRLIQNGVSVFTNLEDMLSSINSIWEKKIKAKKLMKKNDDSDGILTLLKKGTLTTDKIANALKINIQDIIVKLSTLEMKRLIKNDSAGNWSLVQ